MSLSFILIIMLPQIDLETLPFGVLGFAARSGTGKTTLLKLLIPILKSKGIRLGLIKHTHHKITFDNRGLTKRVFKEGTDVIAVSPVMSMAEWHHNEEKDALLAGIETYQSLPIDLLLVEGFKAYPFPKIELHRQAVSAPLLCQSDAHIIALVSDVPEQFQQQLSLPLFDSQAIETLADWIIQTQCQK